MKVIITTLVLFFLAVQGSVMLYHRDFYKTQTENKGFEDLTLVTGDHSFYRNAIISLVEYSSLVDRINTFQSAQFPGKHALPATTFNWFENMYARAYPFPPYKVGLAWTGSLITFFIPKVFFDTYLPRLFFVNLVLTIFSTVLLFKIVYRISLSYSGAAFATALFASDVALLHTSFSTQSHTTGGTFWFLWALFLFLKSLDEEQISPLFIGLCLGLSVQTSPHLVPWSLGLSLAVLMTRNRRKIFWIFSGGISTFLYLISVDLILGLDRKGVPGYIAHLLHAKDFDGFVMQKIPFYDRWMWDLRVLQPHILYFFLIPSLILFLKSGFSKDAFTVITQKQKILFLSFFGGCFFSCFFCLPMLRTVVPFTAIVSMVLGGLLGKVWDLPRPHFLRAIPVLILGLWCFNSLYAFEWIEKPEIPHPSNVLALNDLEVIRLNQIAYFQYIRNGGSAPFQDPFPAEFKTKSLEELVSNVDKKEIKKEDLYLEVRPTDMINAYAATGRLYEGFVSRPWHGITPAKLKDDFRLYDELMAFRRNGMKSKQDCLVYPHERWKLNTFGHESGYWLIYRNGFRAYTKGLALEDLDMNSVYYFKYSALKTFVEENKTKQGQQLG